MRDIRNHPWQKKIQHWNDHMESIKKGEKMMNQAAEKLTDDLKSLIGNKTETYDKLMDQSNTMKSKVEAYEQTVQKLRYVREAINEKEKAFLGVDKKLEIQEGIKNLKVYYSCIANLTYCRMKLK